MKELSSSSSFDTEDSGDMFLRNVGWLPTGYTALYPRRVKSSIKLHALFIDWKGDLQLGNHYILMQDFVNGDNGPQTLFNRNLFS
jgi:hypothetical protein